MWRFLRIRKDRVILLVGRWGLRSALGLRRSAIGTSCRRPGFRWRSVRATGPRRGSSRAYAEALAERRREIRLRIVLFDDVKSSAEALEQNKTDLAVVAPGRAAAGQRLDRRDPARGGPRHRSPRRRTRSPTSRALAQKRLGVVSHHDADLPAIGTVLRHYDLASPNLTLVPLERGMVAEAFASKRIDALAFLAAPVSREATEIMGAVLAASDGKVTVDPGRRGRGAGARRRRRSPPRRFPVGSLAGRPKLPAEEVKTIAVSYRLMARTEADRVVISKVAQYLFQMRSRIAQTAPVGEPDEGARYRDLNERHAAQSSGRDRLLQPRADDFHGSLRRLALARAVRERRYRLRLRVGGPALRAQTARARRQGPRPAPLHPLRGSRSEGGRSSSTTSRSRSTASSRTRCGMRGDARRTRRP